MIQESGTLGNELETWGLFGGISSLGLKDMQDNRRSLRGHTKRMSLVNMIEESGLFYRNQGIKVYYGNNASALVLQERLR